MTEYQNEPVDIVDQTEDYTVQTMHYKRILKRRLPLIMVATFLYYIIRFLDSNAIFNPVNSRTFELLIVLILLFTVYSAARLFAIPCETLYKESTYKELKRLHELTDFLSVVPYLMAFISLVNMFFVSFSPISGTSMEPSFSDNEAVIFEHVSTTYERFDVIIIEVAELDEPYLIKRVIGLPGETVLIQDNQIYINGELLVQDFIDQDRVKTYCITSQNINSCSFIVPHDAYFVLGDNRDGNALDTQISGYSVDSRSFGSVPLDNIHGRVLFTFKDYNLLD